MLVGAERDGRKLERTWSGLVEARYETLNRESGERTRFTLLLARDGPLAGLPVQIRHRPNWWFDIVLDLVEPPG